MYFGGWFYTADTFYLKISLFYFTDIPTYKKNRDYLFPSLTGGRFYTTKAKGVDGSTQLKQAKRMTPHI